MKARTKGQRVVLLVDGSQLVPHADWVNITQVEQEHPFTLKLVEIEEVELMKSPTTVVDDVVDNDKVTDLYDILVEKSIEELRALCDEVGIEYKEGNNRPQLAKKLVEYEEQNK